MKITRITEQAVIPSDGEASLGTTPVDTATCQDRSAQYCEKTFSDPNRAVNASTNSFATVFEQYAEKTNSFGKE